jgi:hypothetical protein
MECVTRFWTNFFLSWIRSFLGPDYGVFVFSNFLKIRRDIRDFWCLTGVKDTGKAYYTGVIDTAVVYYTGVNIALPVSATTL